MSDPMFLTLAQMMERLNRGKSAIYKLIHAGELAPSQNGLWPLAEVRRFERAAYVAAQRARMGRIVDTETNANRKFG